MVIPTEACSHTLMFLINCDPAAVKNMTIAYFVTDPPAIAHQRVKCILDRMVKREWVDRHGVKAS